jgi:hypothetical protein
MADETWFSAFPDETKGHMQTHGWDKLEPAAAFDAAFKSFRETQKKLGIEPDRVLRLPDKDDAAGWKSVYTKLGAPETPEGYDFSTVKKADGSALDEGFAAFLRSTVAELNMPKEAAAKLAAAVVKHYDDARAAGDTTAETKRTADATALEAELQRRWGAQYAANDFSTKRYATQLGMSADVQALLSAETWAHLAIAAERGGEAGLPGAGAGGGGNRSMTKEQARATLNDRARDPDWVARRNKGGKDEFVHLTTIITGSRPAA